MEKIRVSLPINSYDILIGHHIEQHIIDSIKAAKLSHESLIVTDSNVGKLYADKFKTLLKEAELSAEVHIIPAGEESKSLKEAEKIYTRAIEAGLDRHSAIFALGGGVVGDLAGFIAATYMRGVPFYQIPTSLLAQVDSSVGGKVAVDHHLGKNLIGAFYQPKEVWIDLSYLKTLPKRELYTGLGEVIKYGIIEDKDFFDYLDDHADDVLSYNDEALFHIVKRSCEIKADVVGQDEHDNGIRGILNFGHTMGHAIEKETNFARYNHGEAVAIGTIGAAHLSHELGMIDDYTVHRVVKAIEKYHLPQRAEGCTVDGMMHDILHDKKTVNGIVHWVLMNGIGNVIIRDDVPDDAVKKCISKIITK